MTELIGFIYVLLAGIGFGFLGIFGRLAFQKGLTVGELLSWRFSLAAILLWGYLLLFKRKAIRLSTKQIFISAALGCFGYAVFSSFYFMAIQGISVSLAALLLFTFPLFVNLGSHFILKERMNQIQLLSLCLATSGMMILLWGPLFVHSMSSVFYALFAAVAYAIYVLISAKLQKGVQPISSSLYVISFAAIALIAFHQPSFAKLQTLGASEIGIILGLATVCTVAPLALFLAGLQRLSSAKGSRRCHPD